MRARLKRSSVYFIIRLSRPPSRLAFARAPKALTPRPRSIERVPGTDRAFVAPARKLADTRAYVHALTFAVCIERNVRVVVSLQALFVTTTRSRVVRALSQTRVSHRIESRAAHLWNVAENRFFKSFPFDPFLTNFAALDALFTFSSAPDGFPIRAFDVSRHSPSVGRSIPFPRAFASSSRTTQTTSKTTNVFHHFSPTSFPSTYLSSRAPSSSTSVVVVIRRRARNTRARTRDARRPSSLARARVDEIARGRMIAHGCVQYERISHARDARDIPSRARVHTAFARR